MKKLMMILAVMALAAACGPLDTMPEENAYACDDANVMPANLDEPVIAGDGVVITGVSAKGDLNGEAVPNFGDVVVQHTAESTGVFLDLSAPGRPLEVAQEMPLPLNGRLGGMCQVYFEFRDGPDWASTVHDGLEREAAAMFADFYVSGDDGLRFLTLTSLLEGVGFVETTIRYEVAALE